jgi:tRNA threonylcarbamoyladenosine biosynthesis protein TsaB
VRVLALDTSTQVASVALLEDGALVSEASVRLRTHHTRELLGVLERVLDGAAPMHPSDQLAVGLGPGAFTGVRVALSTAKGLHLATEAPLVGVSSLEALALDGPVGEGSVLAMLDARRGEVYAGLYVRDAEGSLSPRLGPLHSTPEALGEMVRGLTIGPVGVIHDLPEALLEAVRRSSGGALRSAPLRQTPRALRVAELCLRGRGTLEDGSLEPGYVRGPDAKLPGAP